MPDNSYGNDCCCFASNTYVKKREGKVYIDTLKEGDEVLVIHEDGTLGYSEIWCLAHKNPDKETTFLEIRTESRQVQISPKHFIVLGKGDTTDMVMANQVKAGDLLVVCDEDGHIGREPVLSIEEIDGKGIYNPFTKEGTLLVNGILASCYAEFKPAIAHKVLAPFRAIYDMTPKIVMDGIMTPNADGVPVVLDTALLCTKSFSS
ncbi:hypothetical protein SNE40_008233 [Patella caerulea]|uniref:Hint domain-containing protein n=1 Tax=Patella caerulea TaxID=87958 RepID=A0AAN8JYF6_PATCE